ncbi:MAG: hypothetical protein DBX55_10245 [Verrucomicrobia bacterium]|nr:MAG: hypothetical protein DBX55_10245 [Verrucomicrobiota bacterium]
MCGSANYFACAVGVALPCLNASFSAIAFILPQMFYSYSHLFQKNLTKTKGAKHQENMKKLLDFLNNM